MARTSGPRFDELDAAAAEEARQDAPRDRRCMLILFAIFWVMYLVIGLPTYLLGCDDATQPTESRCLRYWRGNGQYEMLPHGRANRGR